MIRLLAAIAITACLTASGTTAQSNRIQSWNDLLKPYDAKTKPAGPVAPPEPAQSTPPAQANDTARGIVILILYDNRCETVPKAAMEVAARVSDSISKEVAMPEAVEVLAQLESMGVGVWCTNMKPLVYNVLKTVH